MKASSALLALAIALSFQQGDPATTVQAHFPSGRLSKLLDKVPSPHELRDLMGTVINHSGSRNLRQLSTLENVTFPDVCMSTQLAKPNLANANVQCSCDKEARTVTCQANGADMEECLDMPAGSDDSDALCAASLTITAQFRHRDRSDSSSDDNAPPLHYSIKTYQLCVDYTRSRGGNATAFRNGCVNFQYADVSDTSNAFGKPVECAVEFSGDKTSTRSITWLPFVTTRTLTQCNSCEVCGDSGFMVDCSNIQQGAATTGCQVWDTPEKDFFMHFSIHTAPGNDGDTGTISNLDGTGTTDIESKDATSGIADLDWEKVGYSVAVGLMLAAI